MADITMCADGQKCPLRLKCYRYMAKADIQQSYANLYKYYDVQHNTCNQRLEIKKPLTKDEYLKLLVKIQSCEYDSIPEKTWKHKVTKKVEKCVNKHTENMKYKKMWNALKKQLSREHSQTTELMKDIELKYDVTTLKNK